MQPAPMAHAQLVDGLLVCRWVLLGCHRTPLRSAVSHLCVHPSEPGHVRQSGHNLQNIRTASHRDSIFMSRLSTSRLTPGPKSAVLFQHSYFRTAALEAYTTWSGRKWLERLSLLASIALARDNRTLASSGLSSLCRVRQLVGGATMPGTALQTGLPCILAHVTRSAVRLPCQERARGMPATLTVTTQCRAPLGRRAGGYIRVLSRRQKLPLRLKPAIQRPRVLPSPRCPSRDVQ